LLLREINRTLIVHFDSHRKVCRMDIAADVPELDDSDPAFQAFMSRAIGRPGLPDNLDDWLEREPTAKALTKLGLHTTKGTLATLECRGGGPPCKPWGPRRLYQWREVLRWAFRRLEAPRRRRREPAAQTSAEAAL
jgi:hypothetical protein